MIVRGFLALLGALYVGLALWCSLRPATTSAKVGFTLVGGGGQSEFLTVYGGLEFGLGLMFLLPLVQSRHASAVLLACLLIHGSLVAFRTLSLVLFRDIPPMTLSLASAEWIIFLVSLALWLTSRAPHG